MDMDIKGTKNPLLKRLRGYLRFNREIFMLLRMQELKEEELTLYILGISITDWDKRHTETYGSFQATNICLGDILSKSESTISRIKKSLIEKRYFIPTNDGRIIPIDFEKWELRKRAQTQD